MELFISKLDLASSLILPNLPLIVCIRRSNKPIALRSSIGAVITSILCFSQKLLICSPPQNRTWLKRMRRETSYKKYISEWKIFYDVSIFVFTSFRWREFRKLALQAMKFVSCLFFKIDRAEKINLYSPVLFTTLFNRKTIWCRNYRF